jgi:hypothetical protein
VISILIVRADLSRRELPGGEKTAWIAVVALLPVVGLFAYLVVRFLGHYLTPVSSGNSGFVKRVTMGMRLSQAEKRLPTIPMTDLYKQPAPGNGWTAQPEPAVYSLRVVGGPHVGEMFTLYSFPVQIGRSSDVQIRLSEDSSVSRKHAEIYQMDGSLYIHDLGSTHGTFINGNKILEGALKPGDKVSVGYSVLLIVRSEGSP